MQGCNPPDDIFLIALAFKLLGVKYIFDHHDASPELYVSKYGKKGLLHKALVVFERLTYRLSDVVMATNESYRDLAVSRGGLASEDVFIEIGRASCRERGVSSEGGGGVQKK